MSASARALLEALSAVGVELSAPDAAHLFAKPRSKITDDVALQLRRFKPELIGVLRAARRNHLSATIVACPRCDVDFAHVSERLCPWCKVTEGKSLEPNSCSETDYLNTVFMTCTLNGEDGGVNTGNRSHAHALGRFTEIAVSSSPDVQPSPDFTRVAS